MPICRHADCMFKLRRKFTIARHRSPTIWQYFHKGFAEIDHWFDRENHAGLEHNTGPSIFSSRVYAIMEDIRPLMKGLSQPVATEILNYRAAFVARISFYRRADIARGTAGLTTAIPR